MLKCMRSVLCEMCVSRPNVCVYCVRECTAARRKEEEEEEEEEGREKKKEEGKCAKKEEGKCVVTHFLYNYTLSVYLEMQPWRGLRRAIYKN